MSKPSTVARTHASLRRILHTDVHSLVRIEEQPIALGWGYREFRSVFETATTTGWVAETGNRIVGFVVYRVALQQGPSPAVLDTCPALAARMKLTALAHRPLRIMLLNLAVASGLHRRGIGRSLIERVREKLRLAHDCIEAVVPESNLPIQLLLREAGFRADSVIREYREGEDAYLMTFRKA